MINETDVISQQKHIENYTIPHDALSHKEISHLNGLKFLHMNIRSIRRNIDEFVLMLQSLNADVDIIILTEALLSDNLPDYPIPGYANLRAIGKNTRNEGVVIYYKNNLSASVLPHNITDCTALLLKIESVSAKFSLLGIYRTPSILDITQFVDTLESSLISCTDTKPIIMGDVNIDIKNPHNEKTEYYLNMLSTYGYITAMEEYTRVSHNTKSCIDHIFIPDHLHHNEMKALNITTSVTDHYTQIINLPLTCKKHTIKTNQSKINKKIDYTLLNSKLEHEKWENVINNNSANESYNNFITTYSNYIKACTKNKESSTNRNKKLKPWITATLVKHIRVRDNLLKLSKQKNDTNFTTFVKNYCNTLKSKIRETKNSYYKTKLEESQKDIRKTWQTINELTNRTVNKTSQIKTVTIQNNDVEVDKNEALVANHFNNFFVNIGQNLAEQITNDLDTLSNLNSTGPKKNNSSIFMSPTSEKEIEEIIVKLKPTRSTGYDEINTNTLKQTTKYIVKPLTHVINNMLTEGIFPDNLKTAIVIPIFKNGNQKEINNYRPISLLSNISKIFEKAIYTRLENFTNMHNIVSKKQYGFQKQVGTNDAIYDLTKDIYKALDNKEHCLCIMIDLKKAFDTIPYSRLLHKLNTLGIRGIGGKLIKSYLSKRSQTTKINQTYSEQQQLTIGLPQGTILAPFLFNLYINDLLQLNLKSRILAFADDTCLLVISKSREQLYATANADFQKLKIWFKENKLTLNCQKTHYVEFRNKRIETNNTLEISGIKRETSTKYLGIVIDEQLKWEEHVINVANKLRKTIYQFISLRHVANIEIQKLVYYALVQSHLTYGICAWGGTYQNIITKLETIQKRILKIIHKKPRIFPSVDLYKLANVLKIKQLYIKDAVVAIHKRKHTLEMQLHTHNTRYLSTQPVNQQRVNKTFTQNQSFYVGIIKYNELPQDIKDINNNNINGRKTFAKKITSIIKEKY